MVSALFPFLFLTSSPPGGFLPVLRSNSPSFLLSQEVMKRMHFITLVATDVPAGSIHHTYKQTGSPKAEPHLDNTRCARGGVRQGNVLVGRRVE